MQRSIHAVGTLRRFAAHGEQTVVQEMLNIRAGSSGPSDSPLMQSYRAAIADNPYLFGAARPALPFLRTVASTA